MRLIESASVASQRPHFPATPHTYADRIAMTNPIGAAAERRRDDYTRTGLGGSPGTGLSFSARFSLPASGPGRGGGSLRTAAGDGGISRPSRNAVTMAST